VCSLLAQFRADRARYGRWRRLRLLQWTATCSCRADRGQCRSTGSRAQLVVIGLAMSDRPRLDRDDYHARRRLCGDGAPLSLTASECRWDAGGPERCEFGRCGRKARPSAFQTRGFSRRMFFGVSFGRGVFRHWRVGQYRRSAEGFGDAMMLAQRYNFWGRVGRALPAGESACAACSSATERLCDGRY